MMYQYNYDCRTLCKCEQTIIATPLINQMNDRHARYEIEWIYTQTKMRGQGCLGLASPGKTKIEKLALFAIFFQASVHTKQEKIVQKTT